MKRLKPLIAILCLATVALYCNKDKEETTIHCDALINDPRSQGEPLFIQMPSAFTPNGDGRNDGFRPFHTKIQSLKFTVYGNNNDVVYHSESLTATWNPGATITTNTKYFYRVEAVAQNGKRIGLCGEVLALLCYPKEIENWRWNFESEVDSLGGWTGASGENIPTCN